MITIVPDYYLLFSCKADRCLHSCCKDWEIDIDPETAQKYRSFGSFMDGMADLTPGKEHFLPLPSGDCPFLTETGLCRMILEKGEDSLCQICRDHPRFRNIFDDHLEMGLGLCCERTGELLFSKEGPVGYVSLTGEDPWDQSRKVSFRVKETIRKIDGIPEKKLRPEEWPALLCSLEILESRWSELLHQWKNTPETENYFFDGETWDRAFLRLREYLAYRHGTKRSPEFMKFCFCLCKRLMCVIAREKGPSLSDMAEICRLFSSEIEYSEENMERIENWLGTCRKKK